MFRRATAVLFCGLLLGACGYEPLYGKGPGAALQGNDLSLVAIAPIQARLGNQLRLQLLSQIAPYGQQKDLLYRLEVTLDEQRIDLAVQRDRTATRFDIRVLATIRLIELSTNTSVFQAQSRSSASYNVVTSDFATLTAERDAEKRVAEQLARDIALHISLFLKRQLERQS